MPGFDKMGSYQIIDSTDIEEANLESDSNQPVIDDVEGMYIINFIILNNKTNGIINI